MCNVCYVCTHSTCVGWVQLCGAGQKSACIATDCFSLGQHYGGRGGRVEGGREGGEKKREGRGEVGRGWGEGQRGRGRERERGEREGEGEGGGG